jgi:phospho-N-acetylmuramoyl-pentapeptide-transferase
MDLEIKALIVSFVIAVILGLIIIPILKKLKVGQIERDDGPSSHLKKQGTPTMGGIMMIITIVILTIVTCLINHNLIGSILPVALASIGFGLVGFIDDFKKVVLKNTDGLSPKLKLLGQLIVSVVFIVYLMNYTNLGTGIKIPFTDNLLTLPSWFYVILMVFVMLGTTNAVNLTDGVDGLAGSVTAIIVGALSVIAYKDNVLGVSIFGAIVCGSCLGFLI